MKYFLFSFLFKDMQSSEKIRMLVVCLLLAIVFASCSTLRELTKEEEIKMKSEVFRQTFSLIREKCILLGIENDVIFELDSTTIYRSIGVTYDNSWLRGVLDMPRQFTSFGVSFRITVRGKPYLSNYSYVHLNDASGYIVGESIPTRGGRYGKVTMESKSAVEHIHLGNEIENCNRPYRQMSVEVAIERARTILGISDSMSCVEAHSLSESENNNTNGTNILDTERKIPYICKALKAS